MTGNNLCEVVGAFCLGTFLSKQQIYHVILFHFFMWVGERILLHSHFLALMIFMYATPVGVHCQLQLPTYLSFNITINIM